MCLFVNGLGFKLDLFDGFVSNLIMRDGLCWMVYNYDVCVCMCLMFETRIGSFLGVLKKFDEFVMCVLEGFMCLCW